MEVFGGLVEKVADAGPGEAVKLVVNPAWVDAPYRETLFISKAALEQLVPAGEREKFLEGLDEEEMVPRYRVGGDGEWVRVYPYLVVGDGGEVLGESEVRGDAGLRLVRRSGY